MMNPLKETFSESHMEIDDESISFESRVEAEIELVKDKLRDGEEDVRFEINESGHAVMIFGETPENDLSNRFDRNAFQKGSDTKHYLRKLEDLAYALDYGKFPNDVPRHSFVNHEDTVREKKANPRKL